LVSFLFLCGDFFWGRGLKSAAVVLILLGICVGMLQDLVIPVTNFHFEDKGLMTLAGDVFDVPIRKDIIHRVVRWQLAKRQQVISP